MQAYASQNDMTVLGIIRAYGEPGTQAWRGSTLMLKEAMAKEPADVILTVNHARLCRPTEGLIELADAFQKYGASILSLKEGKFKHSVCAALYLRVATYAQTLDEETPLDR